MKYILTIQFSVEKDSDFEMLLSVEGPLADMLVGVAKVDGHDWGCEEMNIFVLTEKPLEAFERSLFVLKSFSLLSRAKVAYRLLDGDEYTHLWPEGLTEFSVN